MTAPGESEATRDSSADTRVFTEAARIAAAQAYLDALVSHDGASVPFAPDCTRIELGMKNGFSGNHLRRGLSRGLQYRVIDATINHDYTVAGDRVIVKYDVLTKVSIAGRRVAAHVDESFEIPATDGLIHHVRARFRPFLAPSPN